MLYTAPLAVEPRRATIEPFGWDDRLEKAQADRYMPYLKALIGPQDRYVHAAEHYSAILTAIPQALAALEVNIHTTCR